MEARPGAGRGPVVIVGISTRALAESAARAGYACRTVDAFGDLDQKARVENCGLRRDLGRDWSPAAAVALARRLEGAAAYVANLENRPGAVRRLAAGRRLLGNGPAALTRARDPWAVSAVVRAAGGRTPETLSAAEAARADPWRDWLRKPVRGGGGSGVRPWVPGAPLGRHELLQERIDGVPASAAFAADGRRAVLLGLAAQLPGEPAFGASGFRYAGSLFPLHVPGTDPAALAARAAALADALTAAFALRGVNGIDFIVRDGEPYVLELNPRFTASMELIERALGISIFETHARAAEGELPERPPAAPRGVVFGKAVVYARRALVAGETPRWLGREDVRDLPFPGERIPAGRPVCTVFASGPDAAACRAALAAAAQAVEETLAAGGP